MPKKPAKGPAKAGPLPKKIKKVSDLPKWFAVANYAHLKEYGALEWCLLLEHLLRLRNDLVSGKLVSDWRDNSRKLEFTDGEITDLSFLNALETPVPAELVRGAKKRALSRPPENLHFVGVQSINSDHRLEIARTVDQRALYSTFKEERSYARGLLKKHSSPFFVDRIGTPDSPTGYHCKRSAGVIAVDMWLPDDILVANFKRWLSAARGLRKQFAARRMFNANDFARWVDDGFVPYCLLRMWASLRDVEITQPVFVEALFPTRRSVTVDQFRKTKAPHYEEWFNYWTLELLQAQSEFEVLREIEEKIALKNLPEK